MVLNPLAGISDKFHSEFIEHPNQQRVISNQTRRWNQSIDEKSSAVLEAVRAFL